MIARFAAGLRAARSLAFVGLLAPTLGACAYGVGDLFGDDPPPPPPPVFVPKTEAEQRASGADTAAAGQAEAQESFPQLEEVPERPAPETPPAETAAISQSLAADRQNAQYTREQLTGVMSDGGETAAAPAARSAASTSAGSGSAAAAATTSAAASSAAATGQASTTAGSGMVPAPPSAGDQMADATMAEPRTAASKTAASATASDQMAASPSSAPPPSDESASVQRAIASRPEMTEGTTRGSDLQDRTERPVLQRTERLTAALNSPDASASEVDAFTRRMAAESPAASAAAPGTGLTAAGAAPRSAATQRSYPASSRGMQDGSMVTAPEVSSSRADELLAARASAELAAYEAQQQGRMTETVTETETVMASRAGMVESTTVESTEVDTTTVGRADGQERTPAPQLTTRTTSAAASRSDMEMATQRALDQRQQQAGMVATENVTMVEEVTPSGRVTTVETMQETVSPAPARQPARPAPQSLTEIYEAQLRASSAATLQQAAREGAALAAADTGTGYPQAVASPRQAPAYAAPYPTRTAGYGQSATYGQAAGYGAGTVVVSGTGTTGMVGPTASGYAPAAYAGGTLPGGVKAGTIRFNVGSSRLGGGDLETLRRIAQQYRQFGGRVLVLGHASSRTADMAPEEHKIVNFDISLARAEAVAAQLGRYGVPAAAILVEARSDMDPIYFEAMPAAEAANRRAEVYFLR